MPQFDLKEYFTKNMIKKDFAKFDFKQFETKNRLSMLFRAVFYDAYGLNTKFDHDLKMKFHSFILDDLPNTGEDSSRPRYVDIAELRLFNIFNFTFLVGNLISKILLNTVVYHDVLYPAYKAMKAKIEENKLWLIPLAIPLLIDASLILLTRASQLALKCLVIIPSFLLSKAITGFNEHVIKPISEFIKTGVKKIKDKIVEIFFKEKTDVDKVKDKDSKAEKSIISTLFSTISRLNLFSFMFNPTLTVAKTPSYNVLKKNINFDQSTLLIDDSSSSITQNIEDLNCDSEFIPQHIPSLKNDKLQADEIDMMQKKEGVILSEDMPIKLTR